MSHPFALQSLQIDSVMSHLLGRDGPSSQWRGQCRDVESSLPGKDIGVSCQAPGGLVSGAWIPPFAFRPSEQEGSHPSLLCSLLQVPW